MKIPFSKIFYRPSFKIGLDIDKTCVWLAIIKKEGKNLTIQETVTIEKDVKLLYNFFKPFQKVDYEIVTGLLGSDVFLRRLSFQLKSRRAILSTLPFQLDGFLPISKEEAINLVTFYPEEENKTSIRLIASSKSALSVHLEKLHKMEVDPDVVSAVPMALMRFAKFFFPAIDSLIVYHIGSKMNTLIAMTGTLTLSQTHQEGGIKELERVMEYLEKKAKSISNLLITGLDPHLEQFRVLKEFFSKKYTILDSPDLSTHAISIGLGMDRALKDEESLQFRTGGSLSRNRQNKQSKFLYHFAAASFCLLLFSSIAGKTYLKKTEKALHQHLAKTFSMKGNRDVYSMIALVEKKVAKTKKGLTNSSQILTSDLLSWLSTLPESQGIEMKKNSYELVKNSIKVELELISTSLEKLEAFHQFLQKSPFIDASKKVKWLTQREGVEVTFYLKNEK
ncbi:MAG: hypothetical protein L0207_03830 [Chlamydiae bacterium]|nr:hypothetical protein [Chlamydiota bacterium]